MKIIKNTFTILLNIKGTKQDNFFRMLYDNGIIHIPNIAVNLKTSFTIFNKNSIRNI